MQSFISTQKSSIQYEKQYSDVLTKYSQSIITQYVAAFVCHLGVWCSCLLAIL